MHQVSDPEQPGDVGPRDGAGVSRQARRPEPGQDHPPDTRAGGGYVAAPGSATDHGVYRVTDDTDPVELPAWLVQVCTERATVAPARATPPTSTVGGVGGRTSAYVAAAIAAETGAPGAPGATPCPARPMPSANSSAPTPRPNPTRSPHSRTPGPPGVTTSRPPKTSAPTA
ncbi:MULTISPECIES: bifunctional DNA primase/polymerase [unclassified Amycolatopsis]|uniref:bifunctional DNA primase/polymerase n=1 Tax=unclassified Amycolatopsis TaxID=2618356 RepID=UPI001C6A27FD|nr:bifunctional DNA primase/polymerase [Amycolatopsis sp. DSM 110486]QYN19860.1 bifunctional DNA primase/polymerase [Amycolatopsis sp. DSM 110486]